MPKKEGVAYEVVHKSVEKLRDVFWQSKPN